jgi:hypothetical protein
VFNSSLLAESYICVVHNAQLEHNSCNKYFKVITLKTMRRIKYCLSGNDDVKEIKEATVPRHKFSPFVALVPEFCFPAVFPCKYLFSYKCFVPVYVCINNCFMKRLKVKNKHKCDKCLQCRIGVQGKG